MKITKQIIAAMGFASLLFAPLAQAAISYGGNVGFTLIPDGFSVTATKIDFGQIIPNEDASSVLSITCTGSGEVNTATATANFTRISGNPQCGVVKVTAGSDDITFTLEAVVTPLTGEGADIAPTLNFYLSDNVSNLVGLESVQPDSDSTAISGGRSIAAEASDVFKVAGSITVAARQEPGEYTGTYTVTARIVTPSP